MSKVPKWHVKAVYMIFALALVVSLSGAFAVSAAPASTAGAAGEEQTINTLRIYGKGGESAAFPYTDFQAPFAPQSSQAPAKDFIQWNPAYLDHGDDESAGIYGGFYSEITANDVDASMKVHLRQWYVPEYCEPSGIVWADQGAVESPDIIKEYTYVLVKPATNNPVAGMPTQTSIAFPISDQDRIPELYPEIGLDDYDADNDGAADILNINAFGRVGTTTGPPAATTYAFSPCATTLVGAVNHQIAANTLWMDVSIDLQVGIGDEIRFFDHSFTVTDLNTAGVHSLTGDLAYSGNADDDTIFSDIIVYEDQTLSAGRHKSDVNVEDLTTDTVAVGIASPDAPPSQSEAFIAGDSYLRLIKAPWYIQITGTVSETEANIRVGRLLVEGEAFFVDGAEYEMARIYTVCCSNASECDHTLEVNNELIGIGNGSETVFGPVTFASCNGSYFADCDKDLDIDAYQTVDSSPDIIAYVDGVAKDIANFDTVAGTVNLSVAPLLNQEVTITYCYHPEALKYITVRNGLPKYDDVDLDELSVVKTAIQECPENIPVIPPFNFEHDIVDDTNIPDAFQFTYLDENDQYQDCPMPDVQLPDNLEDSNDLDSPDTVDWGTFVDAASIDGHPTDRATQDDTLVMVTCSPATFTWVYEADGYGDVTFLPFAYNTIDERIIQDVESVEECFVQEEKEPRFDTNYLEEKFCEGCEDCEVTCTDECGDPYSTPCPTACAEEYECYEEWRWINIETNPWLYTELMLPEQPDITDPINGDDGDYILTSSFLTEDSSTPTCADDDDECTEDTCGDPVYSTKIRMKLVYDAAVGEINSADIYVNDGIYNAEFNDEDGDSGTVIDVASVRIYGKCNESAAFPYTTYKGPFDLTSSEAPTKDFIQWNPAYMDHDDTASLGDYGILFSDIEASNIDANEKVHLRQWYVPKYQEPSGMVWYSGVSGVCDIGPSIIQEYTYTLLDADNNPVAGKPGMSALVLPVADQPANEQIGLDSVDVNNDGVGDITHLETISAVDPDAGNDDGDALWPAYDRTEAYSCNPNLVTVDNEIPGLTRWIDISTGRIKVETGDEIRFLDHSVVVGSISAATQQVNLQIKYIGRRYLEDGSATSALAAVEQTVSAGRHAVSVETLTGSPSLPPSQSAEFKEGSAAGGSDLQLIQQPWYVQVLAISDGYANIVVGRMLVEGESLFVDGAEYEIARIHTCPLPANGDTLVTNLSEYGLKYITIRNDLPKFYAGLDACDEDDLEVDLGDMSIWKTRIHPCYEWPCDSYIYDECTPDVTVSTCIPMLPPFNSEHDMVDDINIPEVSNSLDPDEQEIDNSSLSHISDCYDTIDERIVRDVDAIEECWKDEDKETRYDTNLLEEKFSENETTLAEYWEWKNIETLPWDYTEFVLPALPDAPTETGYTTGDYIVVSSFMTEDTNCYCAEDVVDVGEDYVCSNCQLQTIRMKFVFDQEYSLSDTSKTGIYVNTINVCEAWPIADAGGPYSGLEGVAVSLDGSASGATSPYSYAWDLDNDGLYDDSTVEDPSNTWATAGDYTIGLKVTDALGCVGYDTATVSIEEQGTCPDPIEIDASPFLGVYPGPDCALPAAMTNIAGDDCTAITVWGTEGGSWVSYDVESGAGLLGTYGLDEGQAYVITHEDCDGTDWLMCCDYP